MLNSLIAQKQLIHYSIFEIMSGLPLAINTQFVRTLPETGRNQMRFGQGITERIGLLTTGIGVLEWCDVYGKNISICNGKNFFYRLRIFISLIHINYLDIMRTFLNNIKDETLNEIKTSLVILWSFVAMNDSIICFFSKTHWYSFPNESICLKLAESAVRRVVLLYISTWLIIRCEAWMSFPCAAYAYIVFHF